MREESCVHTVIFVSQGHAIEQGADLPIRVRHHEFPAIYPTTLARDAKQLQGKSADGAIWNRAQFHYGHVS